MTEDDDDRDEGVIFLSPMFLSNSFGSGRRPGCVICGVVERRSFTVTAVG